MREAGKGSTPRPFSVSNEEYAKRWDAIFGKDLNDTDDTHNDGKDTEHIPRDTELDKK